MSEISLKTIVFSALLFFFLIINVHPWHLFKGTDKLIQISGKPGWSNALHLCFTGGDTGGYRTDTNRPIRKQVPQLKVNINNDSASQQAGREKKSKLQTGNHWGA